MRRLPIAALAFLAAGPVLALEPVMPAHVAAEMFCMARIVGDMRLAEPYFTAELSYAIEKAMAQNAVIQKQHPDEKPPLGDGVPWSSWPDAAAECVVDYAAAKATPAEIPVTYTDAGEPKTSWSDTLVLLQVEGEWKLDDIAYGVGGRLTETLVAAFEP
jgi:hypothetical protein